jgi:hypothetical protein
MDNTETYAIVPVYNNKPPSDAIVWGSIGEVTEYIGQSVARAEAEKRLARKQEQLKTDAEALARAQKLTADAIPRITAMGDALVAAREKQHRRDAAAKKAEQEAVEARRVQEMLDRLPDPDDPDAGSGDDGDLQSPNTPPDKEHLKTESFGDLPEDIKRGTPAPIGPDYQPTLRDLDHQPKQAMTPIAISLNEA